MGLYEVPLSVSLLVISCDLLHPICSYSLFLYEQEGENPASHK